ncbi:ankyrin-3-like [Saccostrea cucullata]|uniref:ankyrin-3-like n=1 Tax=Saccostrea cuccullata TaxID=36930 RepID=UPI002ED5DA84
MCRHVFSLLFHIKETTDEKLDSIFQEIQKIKQCITREFLDNKTTGQLKSISKDLGQIETHTSSQGNVYDCTENRSSIPTVDVLECGSTGTSLVSNDKCGMEFKRKRAVDNRNEDKKRSKSQECTQMEKSNTLASDQLETKDKENHQSESTVEGLHFTQMATGSGLHSSCLGGKTESEYPDLNLTVDENGWRAVHFAAQKENIHFLKVLAEESIPVTETTKDNATILHIACENAQYEMCQHILSQYPDMLKVVETKGWNAAHFASQGGDVCILQLLEEEGLSVTETTKDNLTILHIACLYTQIEMCQYILSQYPYLLKALDTKGRNAAHFAAQGGDVRILQLLAEAGLPATETTKDNLTILQTACGNAQYEMCQHILLRYPDMLKVVATKGWNAAHFAAQGGDIRILQLLAEAGLPATETTKDNLTILQIACGNAQYEMCQHILLQYPDMLKVVEPKGGSVAYFAAQGGDVRILQLLAEAGLSVFETRKDNWTILHSACLNAQYKMCQYILSQYPYMLEVVDTDGWNAAHYAAKGGDVRILQILVEEGLSLNETTKDNLTMLHIACLTTQHKMCQYILSKYPNMLKAVDINGFNAAHHAAQGGDVRILQLLAEAGLTVTETTKDNRTILHIACLNAQYKICQYILSQYPNMLKAVDTYGWNAAHFAAEGGDANILQLLLEEGLPATETTRDNLTILHIACRNAQYEICQLILSQYPNMLNDVDTTGKKATHYASQGGDVRILQLLTKKQVHLIASNDK